jgi:pimeloyl-ACP methyl ester carboxylesterase
VSVEPDPDPGYTVVYPYPFDPERNDYPVVVWANGTDIVELFGLGLPSNTTCYYEDVLKHLASWGYVVIAPNDGQTGSGEELEYAVDVAQWLDAAPNNPFQGKLDTDRIAAAGHSQGAVGAMNAAINLNEPSADPVIDSVLAISMPDKEWIALANSEIVPLCQPTGCEPINPPDATDQLDVPIFFARGTGLHNVGCEIDDYFSDQTHVDWRPMDTSAPYVFATVEVDVPQENTAYLCDPPTVVVIPVPPFILEFPHPVALYPHIDLSHALGYITAWLDYTVRGCFGFAPVAFTGATPEISQNSRWDFQHSPILNNMPTCP